MSFDAYARCYDLLYRDKDYAAEAAFVDARLKRLAPGATRLLELGCGTGAHAVPLLELGWQVHGVDRSATMLAAARARRDALSPERAAQLTLQAGDLRHVELHQRFDAIVSLFHVMSYQTSDEDMAAALDGASRHLQPGGVLLFDFWYGPAVLADPPAVRVRRVEDIGLRVTRLAEPEMHHASNRIDVHYQLFAEDRLTGTLEQIHEVHHLRYWFWPELERHAAAAGLEALGLWKWMTDEPLGAHDWLAFAAFRSTRA